MKQLGVRSTADDVLADVDLSGKDPERAAARWAMSEELVGERCS